IEHMFYWRWAVSSSARTSTRPSPHKPAQKPARTHKNVAPTAEPERLAAEVPPAEVPPVEAPVDASAGAAASADGAPADVASRAVPPLLRNLAALANVVGLKE